MGLALIVNPTAGSGRAIAIGQQVAERFPRIATYWTRQKGDGERLALEAARLGARTVVVVGGDGTISEVCNGLAKSAPRGQRPALAVIPAGTGSDYGRTFGLGSGMGRGLGNQLEDAVARVVAGKRHPVDLGLFETADGQRRYFNNVLSFGIGGLTDRLVSQGPKWLGGRAAFFLAGVKATLAFSPTPIRVHLDEGEELFGAFRNVAICIGGYFGGGMNVAPNADPSDGYFDVVLMGGSKFETLALAQDIYGGRHLGRPHVAFRRCRSLVAETTRPGEVLVDADGEQHGCLPISVQLEANALELLVPGSYGAA